MATRESEAAQLPGPRYTEEPPKSKRAGNAATLNGPEKSLAGCSFTAPAEWMRVLTLALGPGNWGSWVSSMCEPSW